MKAWISAAAVYWSTKWQILRNCLSWKKHERLTIWAWRFMLSSKSIITPRLRASSEALITQSERTSTGRLSRNSCYTNYIINFYVPNWKFLSMLLHFCFPVVTWFEFVLYCCHWTLNKTRLMTMLCLLTTDPRRWCQWWWIVRSFRLPVDNATLYRWRSYWCPADVVFQLYFAGNISS